MKFADFIQTNGLQVDNVPSWEVVDNLKMIASFLTTIETEFGKEIKVLSGYRCPQLNRMLARSPSSSHQKGLAVDITSEDNEALLACCEWHLRNIDKLAAYMKDGKIEYIHLGISKHRNRQKKEIKNI